MNSGIIIVLIIIGYFVLKLLFSNAKKSNRIKKYGDTFGQIINQGKIEIGMSREMVTDALGIAAKSEGTTHKENFIKEVLYYAAYKDSKQKIQYRYKVIFVNDKVTEFHEI